MQFANEGTSNGIIRTHGVSWGSKGITDPIVYQRLLDHAKSRTQFHIMDEFMIHDTLVDAHKCLTVASSRPEKGPIKLLVAAGGAYGCFNC